MSSTDPGTGTDPMNGQTGSIGQAVCVDDADCAKKVEDIVGGLRMPIQTGRHLIGSECFARGSADPAMFFSHPTACACYYGTSDGDPRSWASAVPLGLKPACNVEGRSLDCLSWCSDFVGCDPADKTSCDAPCAELATRIDQDNARTFDVQIRYAKCAAGGGRCDAVFRIENRCYTHTSYTTRTYDCSLTDAAILAADSMPPPGNNTATQVDPNAPDACEPKP
jgi:hypothetical protein